MTRKILLIPLILIVLLTIFAAPAQAQTEEPPVVRAVMFWMSGCKHCQQTISLILPPVHQQYGPQFDLQLIQIYSIEDIDALYALGASYGIEKHMVGVPFLVIGDEALVGYDQVRLKLPGLIETHLAAGGVDLPERPELQPLLAAAPDADSPTPAPAPMDLPDVPAEMRDNGFILAIVVMAGMMLSLLYAVFRLLAAMFAAKAPAPAPAWVADWAIPLISLAGILVAGYLSYIEITLEQAFCGPVGDCNAVQSSPYARLFGVLPVGVLGGIGYLAILAAWWAGRQKWGILSTYAPLALFGMAFFGTIFSTYLTYLEPFVIKAVCIWCVTSAILITLVMLASIPQGMRAMVTQPAETPPD
jgi:uncharacterized membrane protein